jgi:hypothetical protein
MEIVYFTAAGLFVYALSDAILNRIESRLGRQLRYRSLYFFGIMLTVALLTFWLIRTYLTP